jgi:hypothetical protein
MIHPSEQYVGQRVQLCKKNLYFSVEETYIFDGTFMCSRLAHVHAVKVRVVLVSKW